MAILDDRPSALVRGLRGAAGPVATGPYAVLSSCSDARSLRLIRDDVQLPAAPWSGRVLRHRLGGYREYEAPAELAGFAEALWTYRAPADDESSHRILPDPAFSVAFCYTRHPDGRPRAPRLMVFGPKLQPVMSRYSPGAEIVAVKVKIEWSATALQLVPSDHLESAHDLAEIRPALARRLLDVLSESRTVGQALDMLVAGVARATRHLVGRTSVSAAPAFDLVRGSGGRLPVERIASMTGVSLRHLRRSARRDSGVPLKLYGRLLRLSRAMTTADHVPAGVPVEWARVAVQAGYYDQPHLIRECRTITGMAPSELVRERRGEADPDAG